MNILLKKQTPDQEGLISKYFADSGQTEAEQLKIFSRDGNLSLVNKNLIRINSPFITNILNDVPCCYSNVVIMPDISKKALDEVINIMTRGVTGDACNVKDTSDIIEGAKLFGIDLTNLNYVNIEYSETSHGNKDIKKEPLNIKKEIINDGEINDNKTTPIKEEPIDIEENQNTSLLNVDRSSPSSFSSLAPTPPPTPNFPPVKSDMYNSDGDDVMEGSEAEDFFPDYEEGEIGSDDSFDSKDMKVIQDKQEHLKTGKRFPNKSHMNNFDPWKSQRPELQYVYRSYFHPKCGQTHSRIDLCSVQPVHMKCGKRHSYAMECSGNWMTLRKFESVARRWPDTKTEERKLLSQNKVEKPQREMREFEKMLDTCLDWNNGNCKKCKKQHRCSKMVRDEKSNTKICWGDHREVDHHFERNNHREVEHNLERNNYHREVEHNLERYIYRKPRDMEHSSEKNDYRAYREDEHDLLERNTYRK